MSNPFTVAPPNPLQALLMGQQGYDRGRKSVNDAALSEASKLYAAGDIQGAMAQAAQGGPSGLQLLMGINNQRNQDRQFQFQQQEATRAQTNADRSYGLQDRQFTAGVEGQRMPPGFERNPTGGLRPVAGGPQDPAYIERTRKGPQMSVGDITKLSEEGGKFANITGFVKNFRPEYAGMMGGATGGAAANFLSRTLPSEIQGQSALDRTNWWQSYDSYKNIVRNDLFGSALTPSEQGEFMKADIHPGMNADIVAKNLKRQEEIVSAGIKRKAGALVQGGYDAETISRAYGVPLEAMGVQKRGATAPSPRQPGGPVRIGSPQEREALAPGTPYIAPDGSLRTKQ
jgi:hypothetical protein